MSLWPLFVCKSGKSPPLDIQDFVKRPIGWLVALDHRVPNENCFLRMGMEIVPLSSSLYILGRSWPISFSDVCYYALECIKARFFAQLGNQEGPDGIEELSLAVSMPSTGSFYPLVEMIHDDLFLREGMPFWSRFVLLSRLDFRIASAIPDSKYLRSGDFPLVVMAYRGVRMLKNTLAGRRPISIE